MSKKRKMSGQLKIAMLGHKRIPSREGGVEIVVEELATRMVSQGHEVTAYNRSGHHVAGRQYDHSHSKLKDYKGVRIVRVPTIEKKGLAAITSSFFASIRASFGGYDVIHFHAEGPSLMTIIPHIFRKRIIVTIHGLDWQRAKWGKGASGIIKRGEKFAAKYADEIIVLSKNVKEYFKTTYNRDAVYIPNGIESREAVEGQLIYEKWKLEKNKYILFLGRIVPEKGIHYLIEAYGQIQTECPLVIAGGSSDTDGYMKELMELAKGNEKILFTGFVQERQLEELYSNAYLYVLPSDLEGMPISLLEAMSYGNCCLVSDIPECADVVNGHGVVFRHGNVESLKEKLESLLNNTQLVEQYGMEAGNYIRENYHWEQVVEQTLKLYRGGR